MSVHWMEICDILQFAIFQHFASSVDLVSQKFDISRITPINLPFVYDIVSSFLSHLLNRKRDICKYNARYDLQTRFAPYRWCQLILPIYFTVTSLALW